MRGEDGLGTLKECIFSTYGVGRPFVYVGAEYSKKEPLLTYAKIE
jgi:hypothetical protein